jgi:ATP-dependent Clp protease ATP-binding subunit ClpA
MAQNFTDSVTDALQEAFRDAQERNNTEVTENHLLSAFLQKPDDYFCSILENLSAKPETLLQAVQKEINRLPTFSSPSSGQIHASRDLAQLKQKKLPKTGKIATSVKTIFYFLTGKEAANRFPPGKPNQESAKKISKTKSNASEETDIWIPPTPKPDCKL